MGQGDDDLPVVLGGCSWAAVARSLRPSRALAGSSAACHGGRWLIGVLRRGIISYANEVKVAPARRAAGNAGMHGAVSRACVEEMATGARERLAATYGVAVSGVAGWAGLRREARRHGAYRRQRSFGDGVARCIGQVSGRIFGESRRLRHCTCSREPCGLTWLRRFTNGRRREMTTANHDVTLPWQRLVGDAGARSCSALLRSLLGLFAALTIKAAPDTVPSARR